MAATPTAVAAQAAPAGGDPAVIERGAYLAKAANCAVCHTNAGPSGPDTQHLFAGGLEVKEPFGTWRSPNITPDKKTGIGAWTDDQIAAAIREGVRPDGSRLFSIMPYMFFNGLTDADVKAIVVFLRSVPPVEREVARTPADFKMPKIEAPHPAHPVDNADDPVAHGKYLASIMTCGHCHSTPDKDMTVAPDKMFSGGLPMEFPPGSGVVYARNITSDSETGIGGWTEPQVFNLIKTMTKPDGTLIRGPMLLMQAGWSALDDKDLHAVAAFVKALPPVKNTVAVSGVPAVRAPVAGGGTQ